MGANDVLALEANFKDWKNARLPSLTGINAFEYYCVDQFLKPFPVSDEEIKAGIVGGPQDGGVDAMYFFVNRELVLEDTDLDPKTAMRVNLLIMQVKENEGFSPTAIDKLVFFTDDLLDLVRPETALKMQYNAQLLNLMRVFKNKYKLIAGAFPEVFINYYYISKCDVPPNADCKSSADLLKKKVAEHLSNANCSFDFINAPRLWTQVNVRPPKTKTLEWHTPPLETPEGWVGLVKLPDYYKFLQDEHGDLQERIFESNVRGFQQNTPVNVSIRETLDKPGKADFWLLNNGITILGAKASPAGYKQIAIEDPQIVNGLQTSRQIYAYYRQANMFKAADNRRLLVRVIQSPDESIRDAVIRATNSQNVMPAEALRTTDRVHGQIDALFRANGLYYDKRKGQYKDEGKPIGSIVSVTELLQAMLSIVLRQPDDARARPRDYIKNDDKYALLFGDNRYDLDVYLRAVLLLRRVESFLERDELNLDAGHRRNIKFYVAMYTMCAEAKDAFAPPGKLKKIDSAKVSAELIGDCYARVWKQYQQLAHDDDERDYDQIAKGPLLLKKIASELKRRFVVKKALGVASTP